MRVGIGYDVHRLAPGRKLMLGGVEIPFTHGLSGWSDADVLIHAIIDALLGAAALGDIGNYFPPGDPQYKDIPSLNLLKSTATILRDRGWSIINVDATVIIERPKLQGYFTEMCRRLSQAMNIPLNQVNVKANTSEQLGFIGREEGAAAWATASIEEIK
jgi:2-C-methyl-D-erythritol 2,4-cyclodiphosphate synthase